MHISSSSVSCAALLSFLFVTSAYTAPVSFDTSRVQAKREINSLTGPDTIHVLAGAAHRLMIRGIPVDAKAIRQLEALSDKPDSHLVAMIKNRVDEDEYRKLFTTAAAIVGKKESATPEALAQAERLMRLSVKGGRYPMVAAAFHSMDTEKLSTFDLGRVGLHAKPTIDRESGKATGVQILPASPDRVYHAIPKPFEPESNHYINQID
ncbi:hypothetical protein FRB97_000957 [Tulasnella sp. 331]|nr:hypothetical protein FRB97_000957 [Tulasnella sp. 331]